MDGKPFVMFLIWVFASIAYAYPYYYSSDDVEGQSEFCGLNWKYKKLRSGDFGVGTGSGPAIEPSLAIGDITIPSELNGNPLTLIGPGAFSGCMHVTGLKIPDSIKVVYECFANGTSVSHIEFPDTIQEFAGEVFYGNRYVTSVRLPRKIPSITYCMFCMCTELRTIVWPEEYEHIYSDAFWDCEYLTNVSISANCKSITNGAFWNTQNILQIDVHPSNEIFAVSGGVLHRKEDKIIYAVINQYEIDIPDGAVSVPDGLFNGHDRVRKIKVPASIKALAAKTLNCDFLETVEFFGEPPEGAGQATRKNVRFVYQPEYAAQWQDFVATVGYTNVVCSGGGETIESLRPELTQDDLEDWLFYSLAPQYSIVHGESKASYRGRFKAKYGSDLAVAFLSETGKIGSDGKRLQVWHDYVVGTDPLDINSVLRADIGFDAEGCPFVSYSPTFEDPQEAALREYTIWGSADLSSWEVAEKERMSSYKFFKVTVKMR